MFVFSGLETATVTTAMSPEEEKAELQEQLAGELQEYYMGGDNWQECHHLIKEIEKLDDQA